MDQTQPSEAEAKGVPCPQCAGALPSGLLGGLCPACLLKQGAASDSGMASRVPFQPPAVAEIARLFPQLEVLELVGRGGMGAVYKARQPALDRLVALKVLPARPDAAADFAERFTREARALAKLSHPNIVTVHEFGQVEGLHYFIMEYVDGTTLRQMERAGRLSPREALGIVPALCDALQYAHDEGVVHRDIKPENVLVDRRGRVKVADFGLARMLDPDSGAMRLTGEGQVMGTPHYMAPEQIEHPLEVDHRADIYALGVVLYEMLTGELPLGRFAPPSARVRIDVRLDEVVLRALEKEPGRRYQHASEVRTAVETIAQGPAPAAAGPAADDVRTWAPRQPALVRGIVANLTESERRESTKLGLLFGVWNAATFFVPFFIAMGVPGPVGWAIGAGVLLLGLSFYPMLLRMQREKLCHSAWARQQGVTPEQVREAMANRWRVLLLGIRDGRRVIRWRVVLVLAGLLALAAVVAVWALSPYSLGSAGGRAGSRALLVLMPLLALGAVVIQRSWAQPLELLPRLDEPLPAPPTRGGTAAALPVSDELVRQVRGPAKGLFAVGVANWVMIPLLVVPLAWYGLSWQGLPRLNAAVAVALLLSPFVLSGIVLVGSLRMMRLQSYGLAIAAAILAMIVTPGNVIGFPIGIWALVVLLRPEVRAAFDTGRPLPSLATAPSGAGDSRLRRAIAVIAIVLAVLALMGVLLLGLAIVSWRMARADAMGRAQAEQQQAIARVQAALARAAERQQAAPRNVVSEVHCTDRKAVIHYADDADHELFLFVGDTYPGWAVGRGATDTGEATVEASDRIRMDDGSLGRGFIFRAAGTTAYVAITPDGPVPFGELVFREDAAITAKDGTFAFADIQQADGTRVPISVCVRPAWRFGPVVEKVIATEDADDQGLVFLDLETGQSRRPPFALTLSARRGPAFVDLTPGLRQWIRDQDVDLLLLLGEKTWSMMALEMQEGFAGQLNEWETVSAAKVVAMFAAKDAEGLVRDEVPASSSRQSYSDGFGSFSAFRTRRNTMGVYQFEGVANSTRRGVSLRYKRVQSPGLTPAGGGN
jgi:predicted Ser/Thr protein kinase